MDSLKEVFDFALQYCQSELSEVAYNLWIKELRPLSFTGDTVTLAASSDFKKSIVEEKYLALLEKAFASVFGFDVSVKIVCGPDAPAAPERVATGEPPIGNGDYDYTFSTFIVGSSNKFAHAASWAVANKPAAAYNPLFIYGQSGLGKTHLLCAICDELTKSHPEFNIVYVKCEEFTNELINAIKTKETQAFHDRYRSVDVLAVDDIQFIGGKESTQEEFFHTFNTLYHAGKQIILTSDRSPKEIKTLEDRLRTRFEWGLIADIQPPDYETRIAIIRRKAELMNLQLSDDVTEYIANRLKNNIRQLEGVVKKLKVYSQIGTNPTILIAQTAIKDILSDHQPTPVTIERIITEVSRTYGVSADDVRSQKRTNAVSIARQVSMYVVQQITSLSTTVIGEEFGGRDHSTVVYALQRVEKMMNEDRDFRETIHDIIKNIQNL